MLQIIEYDSTDILATKVEGNITENDLERVHAVIHAIIARGEKVRWYFEMHNFTGWNIKGFWEEIKLDLSHANDFKKVAMVGEKKWQDWITQSMKPFTQAEVKYFDLEDKETAQSWIKE